jgi:hypothetical protein
MILQLDSINRWAGDGTTLSWNFTFSGGYINPAHVKCYIQDVGGIRSFPNFTLTGPFTLLLTQAVPAGSEFTIYRDTPQNLPLVEFSDGTAITEAALNLMARQAVFLAAEFIDATTVVVDGNLVNAMDDITAVLNSWATSTLEDRLTEWKTELDSELNSWKLEIEGDLLEYINTHLPPAVDLDPYGFKEMVHVDYSGASTVSTTDRGRAHCKVSVGPVTVPSTLPVGFTCNVLNLTDATFAVDFGETAYMQGTVDSKNSWVLAANQILHIHKAAAGKWLISGMAT